MRYLYAASAALMLMLGLGTVINIDYHSGAEANRLRFEANRRHLSLVAHYLHVFKNSTGHYPTNDAGLSLVRTLVQACDQPGSVYARPWKTPRFADGQVITLWGEPFVYENRGALPVDRFSGSGADKDSKRRYSVEVDKSVYVWSVAASRLYPGYESTCRLEMLVGSIFGLGSLALLAMFFITCYRALPTGTIASYRVWSFAKLATGPLLASVAVAFILFPIAAHGCRDYSYTRSLTPELTRDYLALISKYHERDVISDAAYSKIVKSMKKNPSAGY